MESPNVNLVRIQRLTATHEDQFMLGVLDNMRSSSGGSFQHLGWMDSVLRHPSTPEPLSWSVCALGSVFFGKDTMQSLALKKGISIYYKALQLVQSKVNGQASIIDQDLPLSVLCLCVYELIAPTSPGAWLNHSNGLGKIVLFDKKQSLCEGWLIVVDGTGRPRQVFVWLVDAKPSMLCDTLL